MNELIPVVDQMRSEDMKPAVQTPPDRGDFKRASSAPSAIAAWMPITTPVPAT